jgi:hypothetical protein
VRECVVPCDSSGAKARRENEILCRHCERHEVARSNPVRAPLWIASSLLLLAMTRPPSLPFPSRGEGTQERRLRIAQADSKDSKDDRRGREICRAICRREGAAAATLLRRVRPLAELREQALPAAPALLRRCRCVPSESDSARSRAASPGLVDAAGHSHCDAAQYRRAGARGTAMHADRFLFGTGEVRRGGKAFRSSLPGLTRQSMQKQRSRSAFHRRSLAGLRHGPPDQVRW